MAEENHLLPFTEDELSAFIPPSPRQILRICLNLKYLIDEIIPVQFDDSAVLSADSRILNDKIVKLALESAGGKGDGKPGSSSRKYRAVLVFALLKVTGWYWELASTEIHDSELYQLRASTSQQLAKLIIDQEKDDKYLFIQMLCRRYVVNLNTVDSEPSNALELAVDMHSTIIIGSSGYQRCMKWLWRGWIVQSAKDPQSYVVYRDVGKTSFYTHFDPERIKTPFYQYSLEIFFSLIYLILYTIVVNQSERKATPIDFFEGAYYFFTFAYVFDELTKLYHVGLNYLTFWNIFNDLMYIIVSASIGLRFASLSHPVDSQLSIRLDEASFRTLSLAAPFMWIRMLLYLDAEKFVGAMIVVVKTMMKESIIFFVLLIVVIVGFLQGFLGLDSADGKRDATTLIVQNLSKTVLGAGSFDAFKHFAPPYAGILYYLYSFLVSVILLNILIALYSTAYSNIYENAINEYMALVAQKTLRYIRAPDTNVYVPPLNVVELIFSPFGLVLSTKQYQLLNYRIMLVCYSPILTYIAIKEVRDSRRVQYNRIKGLADDANEVDREWDLTDGYEDDYDGIFSTDGSTSANDRVNEDLRAQISAERVDPNFNVGKQWFNKVRKIAPPVNSGNDVGTGWELYPLYEKIDQLTKLVETVVEENKKLKEGN
ncbi:Calcium channel YVC1 [Wickerhamomyces ciferrii]|uniref:Calcium channel YVC1 n=1 Tax=Wickerhamomyces ciferrii (strain ATCC 14091 / BCRC 22168 / CBS 111 / JCM 3599 / NBRC 0793 / NRRL Y-1031 F-60-10) TaxID=1206466 RepID=K0KT27_WICCF|nr:Calcium channel YVC1 [Wickerhamomyces ciferrii]CCH44473.1 Calcium channel YVC1 [Wickerhamomyces ciferrii]